MPLLFVITERRIPRLKYTRVVYIFHIPFSVFLSNNIIFVRIEQETKRESPPKKRKINKESKLISLLQLPTVVACKQSWLDKNNQNIPQPQGCVEYVLVRGETTGTCVLTLLAIPRA